MKNLAIGREIRYSSDYDGRDDIICWDVLKIETTQWLIIKFLSKNSPHRQGFRLAIDVGEGYIDSGGDTGKGARFFEDNSPKEFYVKCESSEGLLSVYNIWDDRGFPSSQEYGSGMIIKREGNLSTYFCHDFGMENPTFDKIVFSIEKIFPSDDWIRNLSVN